MSVITNKYNLPQALVDIVSKDAHEHKGYGATTICKGTREIILSRRHENEIEVDVSDCINRLFGTAFHSLIEKHDKTGMSEMELVYEVIKGYKLIGKLDLYDEANETIIDYKTATCWKVIYKDFADWRKQGLIYAWLCDKVGKKVKKCVFYAFLKDWTVRKRGEAGYPEAQIFTYSFDVDLSEIDGYIRNKFEELAKYNNVADSDLPMCSDEDRWYTGNKWAVYKGNKAKATRVFDSEAEANNYARFINGEVVFREGEYKKCSDYCEVKKYCMEVK